MLTELTLEMKTAATCFPSGAITALEIWGVSLGEILKKVIAKAQQLGREHRHEIDQAAKSAIDALVAMDLPYIPPTVEGIIDEATRRLGYQAVEKVLDAILAEQLPG
ncbi:MAG: hypothetical protein ACYC4U_11335 [Pirellulaceae bacterium]